MDLVIQEIITAAVAALVDLEQEQVHSLLANLIQSQLVLAVLLLHQVVILFSMAQHQPVVVVVEQILMVYQVDLAAVAEVSTPEPKQVVQVTMVITHQSKVTVEVLV